MRTALQITRVDAGAGRPALRFAGAFPADVVPAMRARVWELIGPQRGPVELDLSGVERMDPSTMAVLLELRGELTEAGAEAQITGAGGVVARLYELYDAAGRRPVRAKTDRPESALEQIGRAVVGLRDGTNVALDYLGSLLAAALATVRRPATMNWGDVTRIMERAGADGVPIVVMITSWSAW